MLNGHADPEKKLDAVVLEMDNPDHRARLTQAQDGLKKASPSDFGVDAGKLQVMQFPPIKYVVHGILPEGLTILAGKPKLGKSWLALGIALHVAGGGLALGSIPVEQGDVYYLGLEDNLRRLQSRMQRMLPDSDWPEGHLTLATDCPSIGNGCIEKLEQWISSTADPRLIVIDTLARVRPASRGSETLYSNDYAAIQPLQELATRHNIAIIVVHHTRKSEADDIFDTVSGSLGLTGAADNLWVLARQGEIIRLVGRGRDLEDFDKAMKFTSVTGEWEIIGEAGTIAKTQERQRILDMIREASGPIKPQEIAAEIGKSGTSVRFLLNRMLKNGEVEKVGYGKYQLPANSSNTAIASFENSRNAGDQASATVSNDYSCANTSAPAIPQ